MSVLIAETVVVQHGSRYHLEIHIIQHNPILCTLHKFYRYKSFNGIYFYTNNSNYSYLNMSKRMITLKGKFESQEDRVLIATYANKSYANKLKKQIDIAIYEFNDYYSTLIYNNILDIKSRIHSKRGE